MVAVVLRLVCVVTPQLLLPSSPEPSSPPEWFVGGLVRRPVELVNRLEELVVEVDVDVDVEV